MSVLLRRALASLLLFSICATTVRSRGIPSWPYAKLFAESDLVVIAEPLSTVNTADVFDHEGNQRKDYQGMDTEFEVRSALKGESKAGHFKVIHFRYADTQQGVADGALFVRFRLKGRTFSGLTDEKVNKDGTRRMGFKVSIAWPKPEYLLFLTRRPDGRYEPVTGQFDAALACREVEGVEDNFLRLGKDSDDE